MSSTPHEDDVCRSCHRSKRIGSHDLADAERRALPWSYCPKCSGGPDDWHPRCVVGDALYYRCGCGVLWNEPRPVSSEGST